MIYTDIEIQQLRKSLSVLDTAQFPPKLRDDKWPYFLLWTPTVNNMKDKIDKKPVVRKEWQKPVNQHDYKTILAKHDGRTRIMPAGIGFVYHMLHPFVCIDVDRMTENNKALVKALDSYTEESPSGNGQHVIVEVDNKAALERVYGRIRYYKAEERDLYISKGYVTITGRNTNGKDIRALSSYDLERILKPYYLLNNTSQPKDLPLPDTPNYEPEPEPVIFDPDDIKFPTRVAAPIVKKYLDACPVRALTDDIFPRLMRGETTKLDLNGIEEARAPWLLIGQGIHNNFKDTSILEGFVLWQQWIIKGIKKEAQALESAWDSFKDVENPVTIKALIKLYKSQLPQFSDKTPKGVLRGTFDNFKEYLTFYGYAPAYNEISNLVTFDIPKERMSTWGLTQTNRGDKEMKIYLIMSDMFNMGFAKNAYKHPELLKYVETIGLENAYNPVRDYFKDCADKWDGNDRLTDIFNTLELADKENMSELQKKTTFMFLYRWMIQVVAAACRDEKKFTSEIMQFSRVLIFIGSQGIGKTRWAQSLFPARLHKYCLGSKALKLSSFRSDHVKLVMELTSTLICNINEIDQQFTSKNYSEFKGFLDTDEDTMVLPYGREPLTRIRRTVFIGSTNRAHFLTDPTGNRRVELIHCNKLHADHDIDIDQMWGQVYQLYAKGERWWFDPEEPSDKNYIQYRDQLNRMAMKTQRSEFVDYLVEIYDPLQPKSLWTRKTWVKIRGLVHQYATQDRNSRVEQRYSSEKLAFENWLKGYSTNISESRGTVGSRVYYLVPPIREEFEDASFFKKSDVEVFKKEQQKMSRKKYMTRRKHKQKSYMTR